MKYDVQMWRDDEIHMVAHSNQIGSMRDAIAKRDEFIQHAHSGRCGIGRFEIVIYEKAPEGHWERCADQLVSFRVPAETMETA